MGKRSKHRKEKDRINPWWLQTIRSDDSFENELFLGTKAQAEARMLALVAFVDDIDSVLLMPGHIDPNNFGPEDTVNEARKTPFKDRGVDAVRVI